MTVWDAEGVCVTFNLLDLKDEAALWPRLHTHRQAGSCTGQSCWATCRTAGYSACTRLGCWCGPPTSPCSLSSFTPRCRSSYNARIMTWENHGFLQIATETDSSRGRKRLHLICSWGGQNSGPTHPTAEKERGRAENNLQHRRQCECVRPQHRTTNQRHRWALPGRTD